MDKKKWNIGDMFFAGCNACFKINVGGVAV